jgi:hypothetical protein
MAPASRDTPVHSFCRVVQRRGHAAEDFVGEAGDSCPAQYLGELAGTQAWASGVGCLLADYLDHGGRAEVELILEKGVRVDRL